MPATWWYGQIFGEESDPHELEQLEIKTNRRGTTGTVETLNQVVDAVMKHVGKNDDWSISIGDDDGPDREVAYHAKEFPNVLFIVNQPRMDDLRNTATLGTGRAQLQVKPSPELLQERWKQGGHYEMGRTHGANVGSYPGELANLDNFTDSSYGNDSSDSVTFSIGGVPYVLWVTPTRIFDRTPTQREFGLMRYELQELISSGNLQDDLADKQVNMDVLSTEDPAELNAELNRLYNEHAARVRTRAAAAGAQATTPTTQLLTQLSKMTYNGWTFRYSPRHANHMVIAEHPHSDYFVEIAVDMPEGTVAINVMEDGYPHAQKELPFPKLGRTPELLLGLVKHTLDEWQPHPAEDLTAARFAQLDLDRGTRKTATDLEDDDTAKRFRLIELNPARGHKLEIGDLVARVEAPTVLYRVTSSIRGSKDMFRILPHQRQGREHVLVRMNGAWIADGSRWALAQPDARENPPRTARLQKVVSTLERGPAPSSPRRGLASSPDQLVSEVLNEYLSEKATETFLVLHVNIRNQIIGYTEYGSGSTTNVEVSVTGILRDALGVGGVAMITVHNHPTGNAEPSPDDRALWLRLRQAGQLVGIPVIDNMVIGENQYFSEAQEEGSGNGIERMAPRQLVSKASEKRSRR